MSDYAVVISCFLNKEDKERTSFILDTVDDTSIDSSSSITMHPVVSGDMIADHMYNDPDTMQVRGSFSLNGSKGIVVDGSGSRLANFEDVFEDIKSRGVMCDIVKVHIPNNDLTNQQPRFKLRQNMVLTSISFVEKINSVNFTFNFKQALTVDVEETPIDNDDEFLPYITEPNTLNFTDE